MNKFRQLIKSEVGAAGVVIIAGLVLFLVGVICLLIWGINTTTNGGWFFPGLLLTAAGVVLLVLGGRGNG